MNYDRPENETENPGTLEEWQEQDRYPKGDGNKRPKYQANYTRIWRSSSANIYRLLASDEKRGHLAVEPHSSMAFRSEQESVGKADERCRNPLTL